MVVVVVVDLEQVSENHIEKGAKSAGLAPNSADLYYINGKLRDHDSRQHEPTSSLCRWNRGGRPSIYLDHAHDAPENRYRFTVACSAIYFHKLLRADPRAAKA